MARDQKDFQRARRPEQKRQRETAILDAARELAVREGIRNISLADIAAEIGMHKTALLRYFETREEIYLRLGIQAWTSWADVLNDELRALPPHDVQGVAKAFAHTLDERPLLCDLITHGPLNLERNVSLQSLVAFKMATFAAVKVVADAARAALPDLTDEDAIDLVGATTAIAATLWQITNPPPVVVQVYRENPLLFHGYDQFIPSLARFVETLVLGMRAKH